MPALIKNIKATVLDNFTSDINMITISGIVGQEDYFKVFNLEGFIQNFTKVTTTEEFPSITEYGLARNKNETFELLEISY
jgi:hypothetical protein